MDEGLPPDAPDPETIAEAEALVRPGLPDARPRVTDVTDPTDLPESREDATGRP